MVILSSATLLRHVPQFTVMKLSLSRTNSRREEISTSRLLVDVEISSTQPYQVSFYQKRRNKLR